MTKKITALTAEQIKDYQENNSGTKMQLASLVTSDGEDVGEVLVKRPAPFPLSQFEKFCDKEPQKAKGILIAACVVDKVQLSEINALPKNSEEYAAAFDAAAQMLPVGKAALKNV